MAAPDAASAREAEMRDAFALFADESAGSTISATDLPTIVRALGRCPTDSELRVHVEKLGGDDARVTFDDFAAVMAACADTTLDRNAVVEAFRVFDPSGSGVIHIQELKRVLTTLGERMSADEVDALITDADADGDGNINYGAFADRLMT
jgi:Ca2+-binding EF-hand superfamily protein